MAFRVEVTPQAEQDADTILEWLLSQHASETGLRWFLRLREAIDSLAEMPKRCPRDCLFE
jgi:plasmid stabilization system protein ParE